MFQFRKSAKFVLGCVSILGGSYGSYKLCQQKILRNIQSEYRYIEHNDIPKIYFTKQFCADIIKKHPFNIGIIPPEQQTPELIELYQSEIIRRLDTCGIFLRHIPTKYFNTDFCKKLIGMKPSVIEDLPPEHRTDDIYKIYITEIIKRAKTDSINQTHLDRVPKKFLTKEFFAELVNANFGNIIFVPLEFQTDDMMDLFETKIKELEPDKYYWKKNWSHYYGMVTTGKNFKRMFPNTRLVRLTNHAERHNGLQYGDGLNKDTNKFNPNCMCCAGGMYFTDDAFKTHWDYGMIYEREVELCDDSLVHIEQNYKMKTDKFILSPRQLIKKS